MRRPRNRMAGRVAPKIFPARTFLALAVSVSVIFLSSCEPEAIRKNEDIIRQQEAELTQLRKENAEFRAEKERAEQRTQSCNRAGRSFEKAQAAREPREAVALYREGLKLCPDDDVAHYELGKILVGMDASREARREFEAALEINPNFNGARRELERLTR